LLTVKELELLQFLEGGRAFDRLWLGATLRELAFHPLGSLPIFLAHLECSRHGLVPGERRPLLVALRDGLREVVPEMRGEHALMLFRLGKRAAPAVRSLRRRREDQIDGDPVEG
jgi:hypothetical protein